MTQEQLEILRKNIEEDSSIKKYEKEEILHALNLLFEYNPNISQDESFTDLIEDCKALINDDSKTCADYLKNAYHIDDNATEEEIVERKDTVKKNIYKFIKHNKYVDVVKKYRTLYGDAEYDFDIILDEYKNGRTTIDSNNDIVISSKEAANKELDDMIAAISNKEVKEEVVEQATPVTQEPVVENEQPVHEMTDEEVMAELNNTSYNNRNAGVAEHDYLEPIEYIPGTQIPQPRLRGPFESDKHYAEFLSEYYARFEFNKVEEPTVEETEIKDEVIASKMDLVKSEIQQYFTMLKISLSVLRKVYNNSMNTVDNGSELKVAQDAFVKMYDEKNASVNDIANRVFNEPKTDANITISVELVKDNGVISGKFNPVMTILDDLNRKKYINYGFDESGKPQFDDQYSVNLENIQAIDLDEMLVEFVNGVKDAVGMNVDDKSLYFSNIEVIIDGESYIIPFQDFGKDVYRIMRLGKENYQVNEEPKNDQSINKLDNELVNQQTKVLKKTKTLTKEAVETPTEAPVEPQINIQPTPVVEEKVDENINENINNEETITPEAAFSTPQTSNVEEEPSLFEQVWSESYSQPQEVTTTEEGPIEYVQPDDVNEEFDYNSLLHPEVEAEEVPEYDEMVQAEQSQGTTTEEEQIEHVQPSDVNEEFDYNSLLHPEVEAEEVPEYDEMVQAEQPKEDPVINVPLKEDFVQETINAGDVEEKDLEPVVQVPLKEDYVEETKDEVISNVPAQIYDDVYGSYIDKINNQPEEKVEEPVEQTVQEEPKISTIDELTNPYVNNLDINEDEKESLVNSISAELSKSADDLVNGEKKVTESQDIHQIYPDPTQEEQEAIKAFETVTGTPIDQTTKEQEEQEAIEAFERYTSEETTEQEEVEEPVVEKTEEDNIVEPNKVTVDDVFGPQEPSETLKKFDKSEFTPQELAEVDEELYRIKGRRTGIPAKIGTAILGCAAAIFGVATVNGFVAGAGVVTSAGAIGTMIPEIMSEIQKHKIKKLAKRHHVNVFFGRENKTRLGKIKFRNYDGSLLTEAQFDAIQDELDEKYNDLEDLDIEDNLQPEVTPDNLQVLFAGPYDNKGSMYITKKEEEAYNKAIYGTPSIEKVDITPSETNAFDDIDGEEYIEPPVNEDSYNVKINTTKEQIVIDTLKDELGWQENDQIRDKDSIPYLNLSKGEIEKLKQKLQDPKFLVKLGIALGTDVGEIYYDGANAIKGDLFPEGIGVVTNVTKSEKEKQERSVEDINAEFNKELDNTRILLRGLGK